MPNPGFTPQRDPRDGRRPGRDTTPGRRRTAHGNTPPVTTRRPATLDVIATPQPRRRGRGAATLKSSSLH